jgi:hypothetical protein
MTKALPLLCLAGGLLLGGVIGLLIGTSAATPPDVPVGDDVLPAPAFKQPAAEAAKAPEPVPRLPGRISGSVQLASGGPLSGVEVVAVPAQAAPPSSGLTLEDEIAEYAAALERQDSMTRRAVSDALGHYMLDGLDNELLYTLEARRAGFAIHAVAQSGVPISHHAPGKEVNFTARESGTLKLDLRLPDGGQPERAWVTLQPEGQRGRTLWQWSPAELARAVHPGTWQVSARAGRHDEYSAEPVEVQLSKGGFVEQTLKLVANPTIAGHVLAPGGLEGLPTTVELQRLGEGGFERVPMDEGDGNPRPARVWYDRPAFRFQGLAPGEYRVILRHGGNEVNRREVTLAGAAAYVELALPEPDRAKFLIVHVSGPDGRLNRGVRFTLRTQRGSGSSSSGSSTALARGDGEYWIRRPADGDEHTRHTLSVTARGLGTRTIEIERDGPTTFSVQFIAPAFVTLEIVGFHEHAARETLLADCRPVGTARESFSSFHQEGLGEPVRRMGPLEPGEYLVELVHVGNFSLDNRVLQSRTVYLHSGEQTVHLTLAEVSGFVIVIPPQYRNQQINIRKLAAPSSHTFQHRTGQEEFEVRNLTDGQYMVSTWHSGAMYVSLPADRDRRILFDPKPFNAYLLYTMREETRAEFPAKPGDMVIEIEGVAIEDMVHAQALLNQSIERERSAWTVLRDGVRMEISFPYNELGRAGLQLTPARVD